MAWPSESGVFELRKLGPAGYVLRIAIKPALVFAESTPRAVDFAGLASGKWLHPIGLSLSSSGVFVTLNFGIGVRAKRVRFGNPEWLYPNASGGQLRVFNLPMPIGSLSLPFDNVNIPATVWLPGAV